MYFPLNSPRENRGVWTLQTFSPGWLGHRRIRPIAFSPWRRRVARLGRDDNLWRPGRKVHLTLVNLMFAEVWSLFAVFFQSSILSTASFCKPKTSIWIEGFIASRRQWEHCCCYFRHLVFLVVSKKVSDIGVPSFSWYKWWNSCSRRWCLFTVWSKWFQGVRVRVRYWKSGTPTVDG